MKTILSVVLFAVLTAKGQTNLSVVQKQLASVEAALPDYYVVKAMDNGALSISEKSVFYEDKTMTIGVSSWTDRNEAAPENITFLIVSRTTKFQFLKDHHFSIGYDSQEDDFGNIKDHAQMNDDSDSVTEDFMVDVPLAKFRELASAKTVEFRLGSKRITIPPKERQKWKLLWRYYDLRQKQRTLVAAQKVEEK